MMVIYYYPVGRMARTRSMLRLIAADADLAGNGTRTIIRSRIINCYRSHFMIGWPEYAWFCTQAINHRRFDIIYCNCKRASISVAGSISGEGLDSGVTDREETPGR